MSSDVFEAEAEQITSAEGVDWPALWQEYGFDTPDACANRYVSPTKLRTALEVTQQPVVGDVDGIIDQALEAGTLHEVRKNRARGQSQVLAGYILTEDATEDSNE